MIAGAVVFTVGAGLIYTLQVTSPAGKWIGYQLLCGFGAGAGIQSKLLPFSPPTCTTILTKPPKFPT